MTTLFGPRPPPVITGTSGRGFDGEGLTAGRRPAVRPSPLQPS